MESRTNPTAPTTAPRRRNGLTPTLVTIVLTGYATKRNISAVGIW